MVRDLDLFRALLLKTEKSGQDTVVYGEDGIDSYETWIVHEHIRLLTDSGYVRGGYKEVGNGSIAISHIYGMTMDGYDFLDTVRDDTIWSKTKSLISRSVKSASMETFKAVASELAKLAIKDAM